ncbi:hypothetical protein Baya_8866 [Bagarius yarrelli]|uniref:Uncharacterized protein n=1 Tax=Bagarius yarrelli TaxID=175774 RepID=A0A556U9D1_BAGYA|nr:hypothetical protein Baya_8866 [Bagarius yarrelli]
MDRIAMSLGGDSDGSLVRLIKPLVFHVQSGSITRVIDSNTGVSLMSEALARPYISARSAHGGVGEASPLIRCNLLVEIQRVGLDSEPLQMEAPLLISSIYSITLLNMRLVKESSAEKGKGNRFWLLIGYEVEYFLPVTHDFGSLP